MNTSYKTILIIVGVVFVVGLTAMGVWLGISSGSSHLPTQQEMRSFNDFALAEDKFPELFIRYKRPAEWGDAAYTAQQYGRGTLHTVTYTNKPNVTLTSYEGPELSGTYPNDIPLLYQGFWTKDNNCFLGGWNTSLGPCTLSPIGQGHATVVQKVLPPQQQSAVYILTDYHQKFSLPGIAVSYVPSDTESESYIRSFMDTWITHFVMIYGIQYDID